MEYIKVEGTVNKSLKDVIKLFKLVKNSQCALPDTFLLPPFLIPSLYNIALTPKGDLFLHFHVFSTYSGVCEILMVAIPQPWHRENRKEQKEIRKHCKKKKQTKKSKKSPKTQNNHLKEES